METPMLNKIAGPQAFPTFNDPSAAALGAPHFGSSTVTTAFGRPGFEKTSVGHFYSDTHKMAARKGPMMDMCHTEDHDNFSDHIIATHLGEFGEIDD